MANKLDCILLIDDDIATNFISKKVIERVSITSHIETVLNGREAIDYLTKDGKYKNLDCPKPQLILLDVNMPIMDGWEFIEMYKKLDENYKANIKIIMLTTSLNPDDKKRAEKVAEISEFRYKPLTVDIFNEIINQ